MVYLSFQEACPPEWQLFFFWWVDIFSWNSMFNQKPFIEPSVSGVPGSCAATGTAGAIFKNSPRQTSRLESVDLGKPVSSIYSGPSEVADIQRVAAWGPQTSKESLPIGVGLICSFGTFCFESLCICIHVCFLLTTRVAFLFLKQYLLERCVQLRTSGLLVKCYFKQNSTSLSC